MTIYSYLSWFTKVAISNKENSFLGAHEDLLILAKNLSKDSLGIAYRVLVLNPLDFILILMQFNMGLEISYFNNFVLTYYNENFKSYEHKLIKGLDRKKDVDQFYDKDGIYILNDLMLFAHMLT